MYWYNFDQNYGDSINPLFVEALSKTKIVRVDSLCSSIPYISVIGSVIEHLSAKSIVWGSGFISADSELKYKPLKVLAVRGPKSREKLLDMGIACPEIYGDPVLLLPKIYAPNIEKKYLLGVIPHVLDKESEWIKHNCDDNPEIKVIDLAKGDVWDVVDDILSCGKIASSSLHGIITADAYGIPSVWVEFSDKVEGNGFKFLDYFESVGRTDTSPLVADVELSLKDIEAAFYPYEIDIDLEMLMDAAPFDVRLDKNILQRPDPFGVS